MTRTTDDLQEKEPWHPFGERVTRPMPQQPAPQPKPSGASAIVTDAEGRMRTTNHKPRP
jgi:hypothetical protein